MVQLTAFQSLCFQAHLHATPVQQVASLTHNILMEVVDSLIVYANNQRYNYIYANNTYLHAMLRAAFLLAYLGALCVGEFAKSTHDNHTPTIDNFSVLHNIHGTSVSIHLLSFKHSDIGALFNLTSKGQLNTTKFPLPSLRTEVYLTVYFTRLPS